MKLLLIRHGQAECNLQGLVTGSVASPLTSLGNQQAEQARIKLEEFNLQVKHVYVSGMLRAQETAKIIFPKNIPFIDARLNETNAGIVSEWKRSKFDLMYADFWQPFNPNANFPEGESHSDLQNRVIDIMKNEILTKYHKTDDVIAIVGHAGTISALFHWIYQVDLKYFSRFVVNNASLTLLEWGEQLEEIPHLRFFNM